MRRSAVEITTTLGSVAADDWNRLAGDNPFLRHEFLHALHESGCASGATGWAPHYLLLRAASALVGAMPLYLKSHSYGEYVFDWAWADAYHRHGFDYYPKLVSAVPFTPVMGPRVLAAHPEQRRTLIAAALAVAKESDASSLHCLFPTPGEAAELHDAGLTLRHGVQFHWCNRDYADFEAFLAGMNHEKRKKIRQERRRVREAGIEFEWITGSAISDSDWQFLNRCYRDTYRRHHSTPYLSLGFFRELGRTMADHVVLIIAVRGGRRIAASLNLRGSRHLYGRYWGALEHHPGLHFETCYYQGIEYCIAQRLTTFEGGAQGEHKIARGLLPVETRSAHWLAHPQFAAAVENFLSRERAGIADYVDELNDRSPFKAESGEAAADSR
jgi:uncharacterized protein